MKEFIVFCILVGAAIAAGTDIDCTENGSYHPDPENCNTYYHCDNGVPVLTICPPGLNFNPIAQVCDYPQNVNCQITSSSTVQPTSEPTESTTSSSTSGSSTSTQSPIPQCPTSPDYQRFPNPEDCASYYFCVGGKPILLECSGSAVFDPELGRCEVGAKCDIRSTTTPRTTTTKKSTPEPSWPTCIGNGIERYPNPDDCHSYFFCYGGSASLIDCNSGYVYDPNSGRCVVGSQCVSPSSSTSAPTTSTLSPGFPRCPSIGFERHPNPNSCTSYYFCANGYLHLISCPKGQNYDKENERCMEDAWCFLLPTTASTSSSSPTTPAYQPNCPSTGSACYPNPESCKNYFFCINGYLHLINCRIGESYDAEAEKCSSEKVCDIPA